MLEFLIVCAGIAGWISAAYHDKKGTYKNTYPKRKNESNWIYFFDWWG